MITCPTCSFENKESDAHCDRCGRPLASVAPRSRPGPEPAPEPPAPSPPAPVAQQPPSSELPGAVSLGALGDLKPRLGVDAGKAGGQAEQVNLLDARIRGERPPQNTYIEGLRPVTEADKPLLARGRPTTSEALKMTQPLDALPLLRNELIEQPRRPTQEEDLPAEPPPPEAVEEPPARPPRTIEADPGIRRLAVALGGVTLLLVGAGVALVVQMTGGGRAGMVEGEPQGRVQVPAGPYLRGLANDYRLMFGQTCKKMADEPETECKEEIALKGEFPQKEISVGAFELDRVEVSTGAWARCVEAGACQDISLEGCENWTLRGKSVFQRVPQALIKAGRPAVCVSRKQAEAYCRWAGGALPTPDQWEKAARGVDGFTLPWGTNWNPTLANWGERDMARVSVAGKLDGHMDTAPVGSYPEGASPYGALDMAGNVAEWVASDKDRDGALTATARGGSWRSAPLELRLTHRLYLNPEVRRSDVGLRCAYPVGGGQGDKPAEEPKANDKPTPEADDKANDKADGKPAPEPGDKADGKAADKPGADGKAAQEAPGADKPADKPEAAP